MPHLVRSSQGSVTTHNSPHFENVCTTVCTYLPNSTLRISFTSDNCKVCDPCLLYKIDCGECVNCLDKPKFGGPGRRKKKCIMKGCLVVEKYSKERANQKRNHRKNKQSMKVHWIEKNAEPDKRVSVLLICRTMLQRYVCLQVIWKYSSVCVLTF